ncbi:ABC transporter substrate-binding protein [Achromobacter veterisilvae]|jgi:putative spermidine/putrescine transport system substrate-binding protein|uniref:ABC transporter substrate-binding protein n=1 Tax=Achromobacter veterisilvae TaxID=2069367 RepID=A0ABZ2RVS3_9BURK
MDVRISKALACAAVVGMFSWGGTALAADLVVGLFGGSFLDASRECQIKAFEEKTGARVRTKLGSSAQFAAAVRATGGKSDFDVVYLDNSLATQLRNEKLLEPIDRARLANAKAVSPSAFDGDSPSYVSFMTGSTVIVYDTTQVKTPPKSWKDLADPAYDGKLAIGDISGTAGSQFLLALNRMHGGTLDNLDPGFAAIAPLAKASALLYTQADQIVSLFERKEIAVAVWYSDRAGSAIDSGLPLAVVYPEEGAVGILPSVAIPKGSKNPELATQYIDALLSKEVQTCFAEKKYAGPVNTEVRLSEKASRIVAVGKHFDELWLPDPAAVARGMPAWVGRWQREVAR